MSGVPGDNGGNGHTSTDGEDADARLRRVEEAFRAGFERGLEEIKQARDAETSPASAYPPPLEVNDFVFVDRSVYAGNLAATIPDDLRAPDDSRPNDGSS